MLVEGAVALMGTGLRTRATEQEEEIAQARVADRAHGLSAG
jgi:hypothetical protein